MKTIRIATFTTLFLAASFIPVDMYAEEVRPYDDRGRPNPDAFDWTGVAVGGNIGTLGVGANASIHITPWLNFRVTGDVLPFDYDDEIEDIDFNLDLDFTTVRFMLDLYPSDTGSFRFSIGLVYADNIIGLDATPQQNETIGDNEYTPEQIGTLSGSLTFDEWSPYIGIGFGNPVRPDTSFSMAMDLGVIITSYETDLSADGTVSGSPVFESDLDKLESDVDDALDNFNIYPVLMISLAYHF